VLLKTCKRERERGREGEREGGREREREGGRERERDPVQVMIHNFLIWLCFKAEPPL